MKTAVEWLVEQICTDIKMYDDYGNVSHIEFYNAFKSCTDLSEYIKKAKEMEKKQIIEARFTAPIWPDIHKSDYLKEAEQYYNETFKSE